MNQNQTMENTAQQNIANDYKVVSFRNSQSFDFTPEMGCMYDGRPVTGSTGKPGIAAGETKMLPYHVGWRLAANLAKQVLLRNAGGKPEVDAQGNPMVKSIWDEEALDRLKASFIEEMYSEDKPAAQTETDKLFARIAALEALVGSDTPKEPDPVVAPVAAPVVEEAIAGLQANAVVPPSTENPTAGFKDKQEVIAELEKRKIPHDRRASKEKLEALLK